MVIWLWRNYFSVGCDFRSPEIRKYYYISSALVHNCTLCGSGKTGR